MDIKNIENKKVLLMRHAEADFSFPNKWNTLGWGSDLAPLTSLGKKQSQDIIQKIKEWKPDLCLVSPTTRTMETAMIIIRHLDIPCKVEFELHEWVPDKSFSWSNISQVLLKLDELRSNNGEWPEGGEKCWETLSHVKKRVSNVVLKYAKYDRILIICHGVVMWSIVNREDIHNCEIIEVPFQIFL